ncbi:MAG TPA: M23 family metallopeptidase, partial [Kofleriaceae bacterium]|nr:M23 family metallopeptidase [Kofleriaceae bacterium]
PVWRPPSQATELAPPVRRTRRTGRAARATGEVWQPRPATAVEPAPLRRHAPARRRGPALAAALAAAAVAVAFTGQQIYLSSLPRALATVEPPGADAPPPPPEPMARVAMAAQESSRPFHPRSAPYRDRWRPSLWYHPLTGEMLLPENPTRKFGARRHGDRPVECGRGHCGVDIGHFGLVVRSTRDGTVERVQRRARGNAGRYVRIAHDDGFVSYYMHLHRVRRDLEPGMRVSGNEPIGIVGRTGIKRSRPHLHFALAYRGEDKRLYYIDPEPLLRRSVTGEPLEIAHAEAPAQDGDALADAAR